MVLFAEYGSILSALLPEGMPCCLQLPKNTAQSLGCSIAGVQRGTHRAMPFGLRNPASMVKPLCLRHRKSLSNCFLHKINVSLTAASLITKRILPWKPRGFHSSPGFSCSPSSFSFANTSSKDLRPKFRTFIMSSGVRLVSSSTVLMPALFKQL